MAAGLGVALTYFFNVSCVARAFRVGVGCRPVRLRSRFLGSGFMVAVLNSAVGSALLVRVGAPFVFASGPFGPDWLFAGVNKSDCRTRSDVARRPYPALRMKFWKGEVLE